MKHYVRILQLLPKHIYPKSGLFLQVAPGDMNDEGALALRRVADGRPAQDNKDVPFKYSGVCSLRRAPPMTPCEGENVNV